MWGSDRREIPCVAIRDDNSVWSVGSSRGRDLDASCSRWRCKLTFEFRASAYAIKSLNPGLASTIDVIASTSAGNLAEYFVASYLYLYYDLV